MNVTTNTALSTNQLLPWGQDDSSWPIKSRATTTVTFVSTRLNQRCVRLGYDSSRPIRSRVAMAVTAGSTRLSQGRTWDLPRWNLSLLRKRLCLTGACGSECGCVGVNEWVWVSEWVWVWVSGWLNEWALPRWNLSLLRKRLCLTGVCVCECECGCVGVSEWVSEWVSVCVGEWLQRRICGQGVCVWVSCEWVTAWAYIILFQFSKRIKRKKERGKNTNTQTHTSQNTAPNTPLMAA